MKNSKTLNLIKIPLMSVIVILCSWITIPFPIPFTLQTLGIYCALLILGGKAGIISILLYIMLGVTGLPVFSGFGAGMGHLLSPTGGFILGFILCALLFLLTERYANKTIFTKFLTLFMGTILCYTLGTLWFIFSTGNFSSTWQALALCVAPFIIPDCIKILFSIFLSAKLKPLLNKSIKEWIK